MRRDPELQLHEGALEVPAMTSLDERYAYYDIARVAAQKGEIVELGTWLGAATIFIAAGVRDSTCDRKVYAYDHFKWRNAHKSKSTNFPPEKEKMIDAFKRNLGPLIDYVKPYPGEILEQAWPGKPIGAIFMDAPKTHRELMTVLRRFGVHVVEDGYISIQDFAFFPSYELVATMDWLENKDLVSFFQAVPWTTVIFKVRKPLTKKALTFKIDAWPTDRIEEAWARWSPRIPDPRFPIGACFFLYDRGEKERAVELFRPLADIPKVKSKLEYFREVRPTMVQRYKGIFDVLPGNKR